MASPGTRRAAWLSLYSRTSIARLRRYRVRHVTAAFVLACALANGGCALSYRLDSIFGKDGDRKDDVTGSLSRDSFAAATPADLLASDLVYAKAAVSELLSRGSKDASVPWENPGTGAHGTVTPISKAEERDGIPCRDFLASYIRASTQAWLQGEACRKSAGRWEVRSLKPLHST